MPKRYYRPPGYSPQYSDFATALYLSRKARMTRGFNINPTYKSGNIYYFRSSRGPKAAGGYWQVKVQLGNDPGSGLGGFLGTPDPDAVAPGYTRYIYAWTVTSCEYGRELSSSGSGPTSINRRDYRDANDPDDYETRTNGAIEETNNPANLPEYWLTGYKIAPGLGQAPGYIGTYPNGEDGDGNYQLFAAAEVTIHAEETFSNGSTMHIRCFQSSAVYWIDLEDSRYGRADADSWMNNFGGVGADASEIFYRSFNADGVGSGGSGGSGGAGGGGLPGSSDRAYTCTCPDFAKREDPYLTPFAPSHHRSRSWENSNAGVLNFPCKHIVAAARAEGDVTSILQWTQEAQGDLPAREFWAATYQNYQNWLARQQTRKAEEQRAKEDQLREKYEGRKLLADARRQQREQRQDEARRAQEPQPPAFTDADLYKTPAIENTDQADIELWERLGTEAQDP